MEQAPETLAGPASAASDSLAMLEAKVAALQSTLAGADIAAARQQLADIKQTMTTVHNNFDAVTTVEADVLVRPFTSQVETAGGGISNISDFDAPAAVVLLVQQFGVAFGALTFVRERALGTVEMYQAAPVSPGPCCSGSTSATSSSAVRSRRCSSNWWCCSSVCRWKGAPAAVAVLVLGLVLLGSIGLGFVISLVSRNDTQAVQYAMIVLLASLFFSGFFLATERLAYPAHIISWLLPATFGISLLRDVMLRGIDPDPGTLGALAAYAAVVVVLSYVGTRRLLRAT